MTRYSLEPLNLDLPLRKMFMTGPILDTGVMGAFLGGTFVLKKGICLLVPPKQMSFSTISNENIFCKTQDTKLVVIIAPNKVLE